MALKIDYQEVMVRMKMDVDYIAEEAYERGYAQGKEDAELHWIPVTEEPKESGKYLVTAVIGFIPDHVDDPDTYEAVTTANYSTDSRDHIKWWGNNVEKVLAWMPLPESYKEVTK